MRKVFAIADLHLSFGVDGKEMDLFGEPWIHHPSKIEKGWKEVVSEEDIVIIAGDISWALHLDEALVDFQWLDKLPGIKVICKGNHDHYWKSKGKMEKALPQSFHMIQNSCVHIDHLAIGGTRLWDTPLFNFDDAVDFKPTPEGVHLTEKATGDAKDKHDAKLFEKELHRLELSLSQMNKSCEFRIAAVHHPPIGADWQPTVVTDLLKKYQIDVCVFGHIHSLKKGFPIEKVVDTIRCICVPGDHLNFVPYRIV